MATPQQERQLKHIEAISQNARASWFGLLGLLVFVGVTLMGHKDADFFAYGAATQLPLVGIEVPPTAFFIGAPILTAALYIYLHLYLFNLWDALGEIGPVIYDEDNQKEPLSARIHPTMMALAALRYRARTRVEEEGRCCQPLPLGWAVGAITYVLVWGLGIAILVLTWWRTMPAHDPWLTSLNGLCLFLALMTGVRGMYVFAMRLGHANRDEWANTPIQWAGISTAAFCIGLVSIAHSGALPFSGINIAEADLREAEITARPKDWLDYDEWKKEYEYTFRRREGYPEPMELPSAKQRELDDERPIRWAARVDDIDSLSLEGRDLRRANMYGAFLAGADLRLAQLVGANLNDARLEGANLSCDRDVANSDPEACTNLSIAYLLAARMEGANLSGARMRQAILGGARLEGANLFAARLEGASLSSANLKEADLQWADLNRVSLFSANVTGADLSDASMEEADLRLARLDRANLSDANMAGANLRSAFMIGAKLPRAQMERTNLQGARMMGADLFAARLQGANLRGTMMMGADLHGVRLDDANLSGTNLHGTILTEALIRPSSCGGIRLSAVAAHSAELNCASISKSDLSKIAGDNQTLLPDGFHVMSCIPEDAEGLRDALALVPDLRRNELSDLILCKPNERPHPTGVWAFEKRFNPIWWQGLAVQLGLGTSRAK